MKKVVLIVLGVIGILAGLGLIAAGGAVMVIFGSDGTFLAARERVDTATNALVSEPVDLQSDAPINGDFGGVKVQLRARSVEGDPIFVGIGRASDVDRYLEGAAVDVVTDWHYGDGAPVSKRRVDGEATPQPPGQQSFWVVRSDGTGDRHVTWKLRSGTYRLVVMNADGSAGVDVRARWGVTIPWIFPLGIGLVIAGAVALAVGVVLLVLGIRARRRPPPAYGSAPGAPPAAPPPPPGTPPLPPGTPPASSDAWAPPPSS
jgi:hypothetical protein